MRILSWMQNRFNGRLEKKRVDSGSVSPSSVPVADVRKDEFSDWPQALLSIGTFGSIKEDPPRHDDLSENLDDDEEDLPDFTMEEVNKLQKELAKLLTRKPKTRNSSSKVVEEDRANLPLNRFLNCPSSLEVDRKLEHLENNENRGDLSPNTKIILNKVRDALLGNQNAINKRSVSFLFKKIFACGSSFAPPRMLRDPIPEPRIEKILKTILAKKIYPQSSAARTAGSKNYLENKTGEKVQQRNEEEDKSKDQHRWVKTDSEYIVLEI